MATVTKTITETGGTAPTRATWTLVYSHQDVYVSGSTFTLGTPTFSAKHVNGSRAYAAIYTTIFLDNTYPKRTPYDEYQISQTNISWPSGVTKTIPFTARKQNTYNTADFFTSDNASSKEVPIHLIDYSTSGESVQENSLYGEFNFGFGDKDWGTLFNVVLNVPPTATLGTPTYATPQYAGLGVYTVPITSAEAYYGGNIAKVTLKVGQDSTEQTYSASSISSETISVTPTIAGTYTPTITVEDSRGQTYTETLPQITVNPYLAPSLDFDVFRSNGSGVKDDEGEYGLITVNVSFTDAIADLVAPTVKINGVTTSDVTWYSTYSTSVGVLTLITNWSTISSGDTIYGLVDGSFEQEDSYTVSVTLTDSFGGSSAEIAQTLSTAFYTIDFKAGGKEIAFGAPANDTLTTNQEEVGLFKCNMESQFNEDAVFNSDLTAQDMTTQEIQDFVDGLNFQKLLTMVETKKLLWTNPNPAASYGTTPISLALADYDEIEIVYRWATGATTSKSVRGIIGESVRGEGLVVSGVSNVQFASRDFSITSSGVNVAVGNYAYTDYAQWYKYSGGPGNDLIIPVKIYGIKTAQI